jgi:hypothetical protein
MAIAAAYGLKAYQLDAVNTFINSKFDEAVYYKFPDGFEEPGSCLLFFLALYGLRDRATEILSYLDGAKTTRYL